MAFTTLAGVLAALPGQTPGFLKTGTIVVAGGYTSTWLSAGLPAAAAAPGSGLAGDVPTSATAGALPFVNPASGGTSLARTAGWQFSSPGTTGTGVLLLYDRLWHDSGIDATLLTAQTVNSVALTRPDALGAQAELWWQVYATMSTGTPTVTAAYTNSAGTASRSASSGLFTASLGVGRTGPFQLASGDTGVRSVQSWTASASFAGGTIGLVLRRLVAVVPVPLYWGLPAPYAQDVLACGLAAVPNSACLELLFLGASAGTISVGSVLHLAQG